MLPFSFCFPCLHFSFFVHQDSLIWCLIQVVRCNAYKNHRPGTGHGLFKDKYNPSRGLFWFSDMKVTVDWTWWNTPSPYSFQSTVKRSNYTYSARKINVTLPIYYRRDIFKRYYRRDSYSEYFWQAAVQVNKKAVKHLTATSTSWISETQSSQKIYIAQI